MARADIPIPTPSDRRISWSSRHQLLLYFLLAFGISWSIWPLTLLNPESSPLVPFGPAIAALVVAALASGRAGITALWRQLIHWRVHVGWYVVALAGPFAVAVLAALLAVPLGASMPTWAGYTDWATVLATLVQTVIIVSLFEEPGWRGFALPRMQFRHKALSAAVVLGLVWALWHLPELVSDITRQRPWAPYIVWVVAQSVVLAWLYNSTRASLPVVMLFHAAANTSVRYVLPEFGGQHYLTFWWVMVALYVAAAIAVVLYAGAATLTRGQSSIVSPPNSRAPSTTQP